MKPILTFAVLFSVNPRTLPTVEEARGIDIIRQHNDTSDTSDNEILENALSESQSPEENSFL